MRRPEFHSTAQARCRASAPRRVYCVDFPDILGLAKPTHTVTTLYVLYRYNERKDRPDTSYTIQDGGFTDSFYTYRNRKPIVFAMNSSANCGCFFHVAIPIITSCENPLKPLETLFENRCKLGKHLIITLSQMMLMMASGICHIL